jgi:hypothetical protein
LSSVLPTHIYFSYVKLCLVAVLRLFRGLSNAVLEKLAAATVTECYCSSAALAAAGSEQDAGQRRTRALRGRSTAGEAGGWGGEQRWPRPRTTRTRTHTKHTHTHHAAYTHSTHTHHGHGHGRGRNHQQQQPAIAGSSSSSKATLAAAARSSRAKEQWRQRNGSARAAAAASSAAAQGAEQRSSEQPQRLVSNRGEDACGHARTAAAATAQEQQQYTRTYVRVRASSDELGDGGYRNESRGQAGGNGGGAHIELVGAVDEGRGGPEPWQTSSDAGDVPMKMCPMPSVLGVLARALRRGRRRRRWRSSSTSSQALRWTVAAVTTTTMTTTTRASSKSEQRGARGVNWTARVCPLGRGGPYASPGGSGWSTRRHPWRGRPCARPRQDAASSCTVGRRRRPWWAWAECTVAT